MPRVAPFDQFATLVVSPTARVFVLTGAGISAESGIATFRDANGMWERYRFEDVASPEGWRAHPDVVMRFYAERRAQAACCEPNAAHRALARLEQRIADRLFLCTQNVDDLHEKAGSRELVHMHGELFRSRCESCDRPSYDDRSASGAIDLCACGAHIRPDIVWFGEVPFAMATIARALDACDVFVTIGSSGAVYPAAGFVSAVRARSQRGATNVRTVYVGLEEPSNAAMFDECRLGRAGDAVPALFG